MKFGVQVGTALPGLLTRGSTSHIQERFSAGERTGGAAGLVSGHRERAAEQTGYDRSIAFSWRRWYPRQRDSVHERDPAHRGA